jgi:hypothetical protein
MLCHSYYCLCLLFNKIGAKGRTGSAWKPRGRGEKEGVGSRGGVTAKIMYTYINK